MNGTSRPCAPRAATSPTTTTGTDCLASTWSELLHAIHQDREPDNHFTRLALVRDSDRDGRAWAYVTDDGAMPVQFLDADDQPVAPVPRRFH